MKAFPLKLRRGQGCTHSTQLFNKLLNLLARAIRQEKEIKVIQNEKRLKLSFLPRKQGLNCTNHKCWWWCLLTQSCLTLSDSMDWSLPASFVQGFFQARILECVATSFSKGSPQPRGRTCVSCIGKWIPDH